MSEAVGIREVGYADCPGGGQIYVNGNTAYVGHITGPEATTIFDVSDPRNPRQVKQILARHTGSHSHKVRMENGIMLTNYEAHGSPRDRDEGFVGGLNIYDASDPQNPEPIHFWPCAGTGIHRFTLFFFVSFKSISETLYLPFQLFKVHFFFIRRVWTLRFSFFS